MAFLKKIKQAIGVGDTTVDAEFDLLAQDFKETYARLKQLGKYVVAYQAGIKELGEASVGMAPMILEQYEGSDRMYQVANQYKDHVGPHVVELAKSMDVYYAEDFHRPLTQYLAQYKTLEERINERNNRLKEMDRCVNEHQSLQGKPEIDPTRVQIAKEKAEYKSRAYKDLNDELKRDIPKLLEGRTFFLDALFAVFVYGQVNYMQNAAGALQAFYPHFQGINVDAAHNWPFVITDPAKSTIHPEIAARGFTPGASHAAQAPAPVPARPAPSVPGPARVTARALYPFQGQDQSELSFQPNDVIVVLRQGGDWWEGELHGRRGLFPGNYVALN